VRIAVPGAPVLLSSLSGAAPVARPAATTKGGAGHTIMRVGPLRLRRRATAQEAVTEQTSSLARAEVQGKRPMKELRRYCRPGAPSQAKTGNLFAHRMRTLFHGHSPRDVGGRVL
jgi:hypothetical protein